uniref:ATP synthase complex subunit 8 n=1 Tax=Ophiuroglypha kinbergi TaxID=3253740 RepID=A0A7G9M4T7_9ECHI|nr:ATP synthase F0 subunit 8 [Ophiura kinbergi]QNN00524.1 ATP synthase F0 subunit 8 [Ophiura kinbergi]
MPQLDFSIWLINLITCWSMFFLVYSSINNIITNQEISNISNENNETINNEWPW